MVKAYTDKHKLDQYSEIVNSTKFAKTEIDPGGQCWGKDLNMYDEVDENHLKWRGKKKSAKSTALQWSYSINRENFFMKSVSVMFYQNNIGPHPEKTTRRQVAAHISSGGISLHGKGC